MHDFPPVVPGSPRPAPQRGLLPRRDFGAPDVRGPFRFLFWLNWQQAPALAIASLLAVLEFVPGSVGPYIVGTVVDRGILPRDLSVVLAWSGLLLGLIVVGASAGVLRHTFVVRTWLVAMFATMKLVTRTSIRLGHVLTRRTPAGEVLSVSGGDSNEFGALTEVTSRAVGAFVAYLLIAAIVLSTSLELGVVVLIAAPLLVVLAMPLLRPLQRRQEVERNRNADLTSLATDIVAGLRILRGIGGERTFARNYAAQSQQTRQAGVAAGLWQAGLDAVGVLFAGMFLVVLTWLGAREVLAGSLEVGQLISFFGYAVFMVWPIQTFFELVQKWIRAGVSARKAVALLGEPVPWPEPANALTLPSGEDIVDSVSGFVGLAGRLTVVVSAVPDDSAALADRLGRYLPSAQGKPVELDIDAGTKGRAARAARARRRQERAAQAVRDAELASHQWGVRVGSVDLADVPLADVRRHVLVNDTSAVTFAGTLQELIDPHRRLSRDQAETVLHAAAGEDVFEALPGGWQGRIDERGRGLSGGQRQRLMLARALGLEPEILVLVEPTSAVDAHTEAIIARRLADHRAGLTTVVMSVSPLLLHHADRVVLLTDGRVADQGTHEELLAHSPAYRRVVVRSMEEAVEAGAGDRPADDRDPGRDQASPTRDQELAAVGSTREEVDR
ncbi:MAG TPA: ABC transporter ATP-binding protein [Microlunatus sp.]|nr:ABC transporter ATP-binding protein [Microlunatus sp.]